MKIGLFLSLFFLSLLAKETLLVSILPQKFIVKEIVGDHFFVRSLIPKGASPASYALKPQDLKMIKRASLYLSIKVPFENAWMERVKSANPHLKVVDMGSYVKRYPMEAHHHKAHYEGLDPHIWLAPPYVLMMARVVLDEAIKRDPKNSQTYFNNYQNFAKRLIALDIYAYKKLLQIPKRAFLVYHPSFGYFAKVYNLHQIPIESEGKEPKLQELINIIKIAKKYHINKIIIEPQFPKRSAMMVAKKIEAKIITLDPLAYNIEKNIKRIVDALCSH